MALSRNTKQKALIEAEFQKFNTFFTAEDLFKQVKKIDSTVGIATIYRFLNSYRQKNYLHAYLSGRKTVYAKEKNNFCSFTCHNCGKIINFDIETLDFLKKKIKGNICHFQIDVHGLCPACLK